MKVLLIGSGGREHALAIALRKSPLLTELHAAPGNPGIGELAVLADLDIRDHAAVISFCIAQKIDLVVIGPEGPLVAGLVDDLAAAGVAAFGPTRAAAELEGSKGFTKDLCRAFNIPTAPYARFASLAPALAYVVEKGGPIVIKADGLAAGKGVLVASGVNEACDSLQALFAGNEAGQVVIEDVLLGEEVSFFALCDGEHAMAFGAAQDHKRVGAGDTGPNTGGMGAYAPAPIMTEAVKTCVMETIIAPTLAAMRARGTPFRGVLFAGLMIGADGPKLIEFNTRFGDPETQVLLPLLEDDLLTLLQASAAGALPVRPARFSNQAAITVVLAAKGYPGAPLRGGVITGLATAGTVPGVTITQAGTKFATSGLHEGYLVADGGRVVNVTAIAQTMADAAHAAYKAVDMIEFADGFCRRDIGWRVLTEG